MPNRLPLAMPIRVPATTDVPFALGATCLAIGLIAAGLSAFIFGTSGDRTGAILVLVLAASLISVIVHCMIRARRR